MKDFLIEFSKYDVITPFLFILFLINEYTSVFPKNQHENILHEIL